MRAKKATARTEGEERLSNNWKRKFTVCFLHTSPRKHSERLQGNKTEDILLSRSYGISANKKMFRNTAMLASEFPFRTPFLPTSNCEI